MQNWPLRLSKLIDHAAQLHGGREVVSYDLKGDRRLANWASIGQDARRLADRLAAMGVKPGERIGSLAMNHARQIVAWFGAIGMGGIVHTLNFRLFDEQLIYTINHAGDRILFYDAAFAELIDRIRPQLTTVEHYICYDDGFDALVDQGSADFIWIEGDERDAAMLCYTSGTTGNPKGVLYEHRTILLHAMMILQPDAMGLARRSVVMPIVPLFHAGGWGVPFSAAMVGAKLVCCTQPVAPLILKRIVDEGITHTMGVPTIWLSLQQHLEREGGDFGKLELIMTGGSAPARSTIEYFDRIGIRVTHGWGMTETSPVATNAGQLVDWDRLDTQQKVDHVVRQGTAPFGIELRLIDEGGNILPHDGISPGQLQVRGAWVIDRYFKADNPAIDEDGWFDTGDVAVIHPDGAMQITDRIKDVIKSGGEWISSIDLENAAVGCPGVAEAAAIGVAHPKWDERPLLLVVRKQGAEVGERALRDHLADHVAKWWLPDEILFVDELPHTGTGKILKSALREQYWGYRLAS
jgi:fatty-acyl-CoA synthase